MRFHRVASAAVLLLLVTSAGSAETVLTPFAGLAFGGTTAKEHGTYGGALGFLGGVAGFEVDFAATPHFFGGVGGSGLFSSNNVTTLMGNLVLASSPGRSVRLYATAGAGLLRSRLEDADQLFDVSSNDFGFDAGGGAFVYFSDHVGLRGDVRYFRSFKDLDDGGFSLDLGTVDYWRAVGGISLRF